MKSLFALIFSVILVATACSSDMTSDQPDKSDTDSAPNYPTKSQSTPTPIPQTTHAPSNRIGIGKSVDGGIFLQLGADPPTLDPHLTTDVNSAVYAVEIYGGLMTINKELAIVGDLAETWEVSPDGRTTTFRLNPNAKFHNGRTVTANDVKWSIERATSPETCLLYTSPSPRDS